VAEDWNSVMYLYVRAAAFESSSGRGIAITYFVILFIVGNTILLALFTALLLKNFRTDLDGVKQRIIEKENEILRRSLSQSSLDELN